jgi:hypothetical protein
METGLSICVELSKQDICKMNNDIFILETDKVCVNEKETALSF